VIKRKGSIAATISLPIFFGAIRYDLGKALQEYNSCRPYKKTFAAVIRDTHFEARKGSQIT